MTYVLVAVLSVFLGVCVGAKVAWDRRGSQSLAALGNQRSIHEGVVLERDIELLRLTDEIGRLAGDKRMLQAELDRYVAKHDPKTGQFTKKRGLTMSEVREKAEADARRDSGRTE